MIFSESCSNLSQQKEQNSRSVDVHSFPQLKFSGIDHAILVWINERPEGEGRGFTCFLSLIHIIPHKNVSLICARHVGNNRIIIDCVNKRISYLRCECGPAINKVPPCCGEGDFDFGLFPAVNKNSESTLRTKSVFVGGA